MVPWMTTSTTCILMGFPGAEKELAQSQSLSFISSILFPYFGSLCTLSPHAFYETAGHDWGLCDHSNWETVL